ncbi:MAG: polysaccharide export protein EpsE [Burkholderiaceae bacterium]
MQTLFHRLARRVAHALAAAAAVALLIGPIAHAQAAQQQAKPAAPAAARAADPDQSRIGPGDSIRITVYQSPDLSMETRVNETGAISYPLLGRVQLAGLTVTAAEQHIASELKRREFVRDPQVQIVVTQVRANQVNVLGQVGRPGRYPLDLTGMRLTEVLALAGGIVAGVGSDTVVVTGTRNGTPFRKDVEMPRLFQPGNGAEDIVISPGDTIFVDRAPQIYLYGEIQHPGALRLERGMTVMQAIAAGGGATPRGTLRGLKVTRTGPDGKQTQLEPAMDDQLRNGDVVYIKESLF